MRRVTREAVRVADDNLLKRWGELVKDRRTALDLSQMTLASAVDVDKSTISRIERGEIAATDDVRIRLARALGVRVAELFPYPDSTAEAS